MRKSVIVKNAIITRNVANTVIITSITSIMNTGIMILSVKVSMVTIVDSTQAITNRDTTKILMKC